MQCFWKSFFCLKLLVFGYLSGLVVECLPSAQVVILGSWNWVPHRAPCREPASPSACVSASLCLLWMNEWMNQSLKKKTKNPWFSPKTHTLRWTKMDFKVHFIFLPRKSFGFHCHLFWRQQLCQRTRPCLIEEWKGEEVDTQERRLLWNLLSALLLPLGGELGDLMGKLVRWTSCQPVLGWGYFCDLPAFLSREVNTISLKIMWSDLGGS